MDTSVHETYKRLNRFYRRYGPPVGHSLKILPFGQNESVVTASTGKALIVRFSFEITCRITEYWSSQNGAQYAMLAHYRPNRYLDRMNRQIAKRQANKVLPLWYRIEVEHWIQLHDQLSVSMSKTRRDQLCEIIRDQAIRLNYWRTVKLGLKSAIDN